MLFHGTTLVTPCRVRWGDATSCCLASAVTLVLGAKTLGLPEEAHPPHDLVAIEVRIVPEEVEPGDAGAVVEEISNRQLAGDIRVGDLESGQIADDPAIPTDLALVDEHGESGRGEGLAAGADSEERLVVDRVGGADGPNPVSTRIDDGVVANDGERQAGDVPGGEGGRNVGVEAGKRFRACRLGQQGERGEPEGEIRKCAHVVYRQYTIPKGTKPYETGKRRVSSHPCALAVPCVSSRARNVYRKYTDGLPGGGHA
jgi:hypothetical protein